MLKIIVKLFLFLFIGSMLFCGWARFWGLYGKIGEKHFNIILTFLAPWQKKELADALNHYYNTLVTKYTTGYLLRCTPDKVSIRRQFNWFYRSAAGTLVNTMPTYDELVRIAYGECGDSKEISDNISTFKIEMLLERKFRESGYGMMTGKDWIGLGIETLSLAVKILITSLNPIAGGAITLASAAYQSSSDPVKAVPGIVCFMNIRCRNFSVCFLSSWFCSLILFRRWKRKK